MAKRVLYQGIAGGGVAVLLAISLVGLSASQVSNEAISVDGDDVGGVVTSAKGPEAGVWVIAETTDLPTKFIRIVVTDDRGRYVVPDLPESELQRVGARLRVDRFGEGSGRAGETGEPDRARGAEPSRGGAILSVQLLVVDASGPRLTRIPWDRDQGQRHQ